MKVHQPNMPAPGVRAQVAVEDASTPTRSWSSTRASAGSWTSCARSASTRTRSSSTRPTTAPGRTSIPTPATRRSAAPRAPCAKAAIACPRSPSGPARIKPGSKNHEIVGGLDLMATFAAVAGVKLPEKDREGQPIIFDSYDMSPVLFGNGQVARARSGSTSPRTSCRRAPPASATTRPCSTCAATTASRPAAWPSTPTSAGRARRSTSPPCRRSSTCGRTRRSATTSS